MYVLLVISVLGGGYIGGTLVTMQEFTTEAACNRAKGTVVTQAAHMGSNMVRAVCVPK